MIELLTYAAICLLTVGVLGVPAGMLYKRILWSLSGEHPKFTQYIVGFIPLVNMYAIAKRVTEHYKICWCFLSVLWVAIVFRVCAIMLLTTIPMLVPFSALGMLIGLATTMLTHVVIMMLCTYTLDGTWFQYVLCLIPPFAEYIQALRVVAITKKHECSELN